MIADRPNHIAELERLTRLLMAQRDGMEHDASRRFAEILLQQTMARVCAEKAERNVPALAPQ